MYCFDFHHHHRLREGGIYNLSLWEEVPERFFSVGLHPREVSSASSEALDWVRTVAESPFCVALGESGLDALVQTPLEVQREAFLRQLAWANELAKPVIVHCVRCYGEMPKFLGEAETPLVIHGFNRKAAIAEVLLKAGFYLSFGSAVLSNVSLQQTLQRIPLERFFLETDDRAVAIEAVYEKVAEIRGLSLAHLQEQIAENLFRIGIPNVEKLKK
ncbi:TatD family hydrolase [Bergeyella sp. RCAD1439]|uniref:TatD family hydrolase n=1 Tax=Bergeyella anatis TaxID=3113737 RepID=UPI002E19C64D|nr:TatD family hydrolase [Bergeyella sp. RCAD1439]